MAADVVTTLHSKDASRCVKVIRRPDGAFGLQEFRKDPEDAGGWTLVRDNALRSYATRAQAVAAAKDGIAWLREATASTEEAQ